MHVISHAIITENDKYLEMCNSISLSELQRVALQKQYKAAGCFTQPSLANYYKLPYICKDPSPLTAPLGWEPVCHKHQQQ